MFKSSFRSKLARTAISGAAVFSFSQCAGMLEVGAEPSSGAIMATAGGLPTTGSMVPVVAASIAPKKEDSKEEKMRKFALSYGEVKKCDDKGPDLGSYDKVVEVERLPSKLGLGGLCAYIIERNITNLPNIQLKPDQFNSNPQLASPAHVTALDFGRSGFSVTVQETWQTLVPFSVAIPHNFSHILMSSSLGRSSFVYTPEVRVTSFDVKAKKETIDVYFYPKAAGEQNHLLCNDSKKQQRSCAVVCTINVNEKGIDATQTGCVFRYINDEAKK